jgi:ADP-ribose pyrophosphatase YjhB (NUDIX family)
MTRRVSVRAIVLHQGKLLGVRLKPYEGSLREAGGTDYWCLPGGGLDEGEALVPGLEREMVEETGIRPDVGNLLYVQQFAYNDKDYLEFFFHVTNSEDYLHIDLSKTTHGAEEIAEIGLVDPAATKLLPEFLMTEPLESFAASKSPTKVISRL